MIVRCGRCQSSFEVPGVGRYPCPSCGTPNDVRSGDREPDGLVTPPPPPDREDPSPRVQCGSCDLSFIVGAVDEAPCPNCGALVAVGGGAE